MPLSQNSKNVLEEMRKNGVDASVLGALERELDIKPNADKGLSDNTLAQASFNSYRERKDKEVAEIKKQLAEAVSLTSAANNLNDGDVKTAAVNRANEIKAALVAKGYIADDVDAMVNDLVSDPNGLRALAGNSEPLTKKEDKVVLDNNNNNNNNNYVDAQTFATTMKNQITGSVIGTVEIAGLMTAAMHEAAQLGMQLPSDKVYGFAPAIIDAMSKGKSAQDAVTDYFGFREVRETKTQEARNAELKAAEEKGAREALKLAGVTIRKSPHDKQNSHNPILDRRQAEEVTDSRILDKKDLPKNKEGDPEIYRMRRFDRNERRQAHTANAVRRYEEVSQEYDDQGMFIGSHSRA